MHNEEDTPSKHLDFHFFDEDKKIINWLRVQRKNRGYVKYKLSLFAMGEVMEHIRQEKDILIDQLRLIIDDIFVPKREQISQLLKYVSEIIEKDDRIEPTDAFIVASALIDPSCIALITRDTKIIGSRIIKNLSQARHPQLRIEEFPYSGH